MVAMITYFDSLVVRYDELLLCCNGIDKEVVHQRSSTTEPQNKLHKPSCNKHEGCNPWQLHFCVEKPPLNIQIFGTLRSSKAQAVKMEPVKMEPPPVKADGNDVIGYRDVMRDVEWMYDVVMGLMYVCIYINIYIYIFRIYTLGSRDFLSLLFTFAGKGQDVVSRPPGRGGGWWHRGRRRSTDGFQP